MEGLTDEKEDLIFEIELELLLIGTITLLEETVSLSNVSEIKSIHEYDQKQRTLNQTTEDVVLSTMKSKDFCVTHWKTRFIQKSITIIARMIFKSKKHQQKYKYKIFRS
jgi:hypothetical protein